MTWFERVRDLFVPVPERGPEPKVEPAEATAPFDSQGWSTDPVLVTCVPSRPGWYYKTLSTPSGLPTGITCHFTSTGPGTAMAMAKRRRDLERSSFNPKPPGSWHFTVAQDGTIIQQLSLRQGGFHAGSPTAKKLPIGWANHVTCGIELEGHGDRFSELQIVAACWLWCAITKHCGIKREHAMYEHSKIDPTRKTDPGPVWMNQHAKRVLDACL